MLKMEENKKCIKCKKTIPKEQKIKMGLCPKCFNEVGTPGAILVAGGIAFAGKKLIKNSGKIAAKLIKR